MPKNKSMQKENKTASNYTNDDFERVIAEMTARDSELSADVIAARAKTAAVASSSSSSGSGGAAGS
jgi:uncharacterized membrane protein